MTWDEMTKEERVEAIKPLWEAGESATAVARRLGCSRNAVIGYVTRHMKGASRRSVGPATVPNPKKKRPPKQKPPKHNPWQGSAHRSEPRPVEIKPAPELPTTGTVHFIDRLSGQCAFPMWSSEETVGLVCGRPVEGDGGTYCHAHNALCHVTPERTRLGRQVAALSAEAAA